MKIEKLVGVTIDTNQVKVDYPIETIEEAKQVLAKILSRYGNYDILKSCYKSKGWINRNGEVLGNNKYSAYTYHNPDGFENTTLWDLLHS